jgi:hypothetical protein
MNYYNESFWSDTLLFRIETPSYLEYKYNVKFVSHCCVYVNNRYHISIVWSYENE